MQIAWKKSTTDLQIDTTQTQSTNSKKLLDGWNKKKTVTHQKYVKYKNNKNKNNIFSVDKLHMNL